LSFKTFNSFSGFHSFLRKNLGDQVQITFNSFSGFHIILVRQMKVRVKISTFNSFSGFHKIWEGLVQLLEMRLSIPSPDSTTEVTDTNHARAIVTFNSFSGFHNSTLI